ncbi:MAG TPA: YhdH/YhfP family quinone oxidoreductase [Thermodesulfobacteriota bacterium]|nr:YhdH/YhfP family quinone oxidoreductase [Thermodesulfobacteriota bacterium]
MSDKKFRALVVEEEEGGKFTRSIKERSVGDLPDGEVLIRVRYSSLNFKDALSATGNKGVTKGYPHTPGIDAAGVVEESSSPQIKPGEEVLVTGYDLGANTDGGYGEYIRVPAGWVVGLPEGLSARESMIYGTAGFTAALSVYKIEEYGVVPDMGEVLVTGATGGVGSVACAILAKAGYSVVASTGKTDQKEFLTGLGVKEIISRADSADTSGRPLLKGRWAGAVDTVGGEILATAIKSAKQHGVVTCCGNVASGDLPINVYPFILRGVSLVGIDSAYCPMDARRKVWSKLGGEWKIDLDGIATEVTLDGLDEQIELILKGGQKGRVVVNLQE